MDLELSDDQVAMVKAAREYLEKRYPPETVRRVRGQGCDRRSWVEFAAQGWLGMAFAERHGGGGATLLDLGLFCEQAGRVAFPEAWTSALHAGLLIAELGTPAQVDRLLPRLLSGELLATVAIAENVAGSGAGHSTWLLDTVAVADDAWLLSGVKRLVFDAGSADQLLVVARTSEDGTGVFMVPASLPGVHIDEHITIGCDRQGRVELRDVRLDGGAALGDTTDGARVGAALDRAEDIMTALTAMEMFGGARRVLEMTVEHVRGRRQFDRPIGTFQAVQHHAANMAIAVHAAGLAAWQALWSVSEGLPAVRELSIAKSAANEAYVEATLTAHQLHGGMGIVREHDLHLWSEHARATSLRFGTSAHHLNRIAEHSAVTSARRLGSA